MTVDTRKRVSTSPLTHLVGAAPSLRAVLDAIRLGEARTRRELVALTGLSRSVVARRVDELIALGLVEDGEQGASIGGRAPKHLRVRGDKGHIVGIDLGATSLEIGVADLSGRVLVSASRPTDVDTLPENVLEQIDSMLAGLLSELGEQASELLGIGMGLPCPVSVAAGAPVAPPLMPEWDGYPVRDYLQDRYGVPAWVDNDVNVLARAELRVGALQSVPLGIVIKVGTGIGAGLVWHGSIYRGAEGCAGDVGHIRVADDSAVRCRCGNEGCLEALAGGAAIARMGRQAAEDGTSEALAKILAAGEPITAESVGRAAQRGDGWSLQCMHRASGQIGAMLAALVNILNPDVVVIAGGVAQSAGWFVAGIRKQVYERSLPLATSNLVIDRSSLGPIGGVLGAVWLAIDGVLAVD